jgi:hypothetical protein
MITAKAKLIREIDAKISICFQQAGGTAEVTVNNEIFGIVQAGGIINVPVENTLSDEVGDIISGKVIVPDATITVLSEAFQTVASGGSLNIILEFDDGSTPSFALDNDTIIIPLPVCPPPPSIELAVSIEPEPKQFEETTLTLTISGDVLGQADYGDYQFAITLGDGNVIMPPTAPLTIVQDGATVVATFSHSYGTAGVKNIFATVIDNNQGLTANASTTTDVQSADLLVQVHPTGARAIWSNFLRNVNYQGDFMRVRNEDNQLKNIPIEDGRAKTSEFLDFIGSGAGYAVKVYSHINGFEWVQDDITNQPRVRVDSNGLMYLDPEDRQSGSFADMNLSLPNSVSHQNSSVFTVSKYPPITINEFGNLFVGRNVLLRNAKYLEYRADIQTGGQPPTNHRIVWGQSFDGNSIVFPTPDLTDKVLLSTILLATASTDSELYINSVMQDDGQVSFTNTRNITMGDNVATGRRWRGRIYEIVDYSENKVLTRADIEERIRNSYLQLDSNFFDTI